MTMKSNFLIISHKQNEELRVLLNQNKDLYENIMENFKDIELNEKQIKAIKYIGNSR